MELTNVLLQYKQVKILIIKKQHYFIIKKTLLSIIPSLKQNSLLPMIVCNRNEMLILDSFFLLVMI